MKCSYCKLNLILEEYGLFCSDNCYKLSMINGDKQTVTLIIKQGEAEAIQLSLPHYKDMDLKKEQME